MRTRRGRSSRGRCLGRLQREVDHAAAERSTIVDPDDNGAAGQGHLEQRPEREPGVGAGQLHRVEHLARGRDVPGQHPAVPGGVAVEDRAVLGAPPGSTECVSVASSGRRCCSSTTPVRTRPDTAASVARRSASRLSTVGARRASATAVSRRGRPPVRRPARPRGACGPCDLGDHAGLAAHPVDGVHAVDQVGQRSGGQQVSRGVAVLPLVLGDELRPAAARRRGRGPASSWERVEASGAWAAARRSSAAAPQ